MPSAVVYFTVTFVPVFISANVLSSTEITVSFTLFLTFLATVISVDDKTLAEMKTGTKVTVKYTTADGKNTAKSVTVKKAGVKKTEPAKPAAAPAEKKAPAKAVGY